MTMGKTSTQVLTDIANAIRYQAGVATLYKPSEMAAAITALDGTNAGRYEAQEYKELESGVLSDAIYTDIANAVRGQNGSTDTYAPGELAAAILALTWEDGLKPRALLLSDGTLEFNYLDSRRSTLGLPITATYEVPSEPFAAANDQPWYAVRAQVTKVVFDSSFANAGFADCSFWFSGLYNLVEVSGFEALSGITTATYLFASCSALETIYATGYANAITSSSMMFYGCSRLVGGADAFVPSNTSNGSVCFLGVGGVLTDPSADAREWFRVYFYHDGSVVLTKEGAVDAGKTLRASGRLCANARYKTSGLLPGYASRTQMTSVAIAADMAQLSGANMNYWFYGLSAVTSFSGIGNLPAVREMQYAFSNCSAIVTLDFRGFDPSRLINLFNAFAACTSLATIYADATWALPSGVYGNQCFYNCRSLVGGAGTAWSSSQTSGSYMRIDKAGQAGYLTAA